MKVKCWWSNWNKWCTWVYCSQSCISTDRSVLNNRTTWRLLGKNWWKPTDFPVLINRKFYRPCSTTSFSEIISITITMRQPITFWTKPVSLILSKIMSSPSKQFLSKIFVLLCQNKSYLNGLLRSIFQFVTSH